MLSENVSGRSVADVKRDKTDGRQAVLTPEGIELELDAAGPGARFYAWVIDSLLRWAFLTGAFILLAMFERVGVGVYLIVYFLVEWFYPVGFELAWKGETPGKRALGLRVVHEDGTNVGLGASMLRNLLRFADFLPTLPPFGLAAMLSSSRFQRFGDLAAGTLVVYRQSPDLELELVETTPEAPPFELNADEEAVILEYAQRSPSWSQERALEVAATMSPTFRTSSSNSRARLLAIANWLQGQRVTDEARP